MTKQVEVVWPCLRGEMCWIKRIETLQVDGDGVKGRPRKRWREVLKGDMRGKGLCREMLGTGQDGGECCGKAIGELTPVHWEKQPH